MGYCAAFGCTNRQKKGDGYSFHRFPKDSTRRSAWEHYCKRLGFVAAQHHMLCSKHFSLQMYEYHPEKNPVLGLGHNFHQRPSLKNDAVPDVPLQVTQVIETTADVVTNPERTAVAKRRRSEMLNDAFQSCGDEEIEESFCGYEIDGPLSTATYDSKDQSNSPLSTVTYNNKGKSDSSCQTSVQTCNRGLQANVPVSQRTRRIQVRPSCTSVAVQCDLIKCEPLSILSSNDDEDISDIDMESDLDEEEYDTSDQSVPDSDPEYMFYTDDDYMDDSIDSIDDEDVDSTDVTYKLCDFDINNVEKEKQFLVSESALNNLLSICRTCNANCENFIKYCKGTMICTTSVCFNGHIFEWKSQTLHKSMPWSNLLVAAAIFNTGSSFSKVDTLFARMNVQMFCRRTFQYLQAAYLVSSIRQVWETTQQAMFSARINKELTVGGDARCDSPGYSAKYGSYSIIDLATNEVMDVQLVQSNEVKGSTHMELEGLKRSLSSLSEQQMKLQTLVTDRHVMVKKFMREQHPDTQHHFDVWHVSKGVTKKLEVCAKKKDGGSIRPWIKSIGNHLYWSAISAGNDGDEKLAKWTSLSNHVCNIHEGHSDIFPECVHEPCDDREWLVKGSRQHKMVLSVVNSPYLLRDVPKLSPYHQTYSLEVFHSVVNHFAPKSTHFFYSSMQARLYLAALHYNENGKKERAYTNDGKERWQISYPKAKKGTEAVVKPCKVNPTYGYVSLLVQAMVARRKEFPNYKDAIENSKVSMESTPPPLTDSYEHFDKEALIERHRSRFS